MRDVMRRLSLIIGVSAVLALRCTHAHAWIYPEHRQIAVSAWSALTPEAQAFYAALWQRTAAAHGQGLCAQPLGPRHDAPSQDAPCIDFADWPALAGDHSCSPDELVGSVLRSDWVHDVARVSEEIAHELSAAHGAEEHENLWITSNLRLQEVDDAYVTRAGGNNAHFLLSRVGATLPDFVAESTRRGAPLNALGLYVQYHAAALHLSSALGADPGAAPLPLVERVLALEAYALHFLQDMYASGHVAGTWGDAPTRKGTHDYYCAHGYATSDWTGQDLILFGDAHMRATDLQRSARAVADSLLQLWAAARRTREPGRDWAKMDAAALQFAALDSCNLPAHPDTLALEDTERQSIDTLLARTPKPGYGEHSVAWPRYRADFGTFLGVESGISVGGVVGSYGSNQGRGVAELGIGLRLGFGLEGVVAALNTGTMFVHLGLVRQSEQVDFCSVDSCKHQLGSETLPRVPSRAGFMIGLRMPFWLIPGDLIVLAPILALTSPATLTRVAMRAASGGLIPWQRSFATSIGHFELVVGRALSVTLYGLSARVHSFTYVPRESQPLERELIEVGSRAITLTFPVLEFTPVRAVAQTLTAALQIQLAYALEIPLDVVRYGTPKRPGPDWGPAHMFLVRISLNGRGYL